MKIVPAMLIAAAIALPLQGQAQPGPALRTPDVSVTIGSPAGPPLAGAALDEKTRVVASLLRCPVCQGMSIYDSPAPMAVNMKYRTRDLVARGYDQEQILRYFESSYGEFVRLDPPFRGVDALVWILPILALLAGVAIVGASARKLRGASIPVERNDDPYLEAIRQMAGKGEPPP